MTADLDQKVNELVAPLTETISTFIFYSVPVNGVEFPLIVGWLIICSIFYTVYLRVLTPRNLKVSLKLVRGDYASSDEPGQVSHFQALATALSGTVGVGNVGAVAIAISIGGPGALFWMVVGGLLGASLKCGECILGVRFRHENADGSVSGGPMYYLERGLADKGLPRVGKGIGMLYAIFIVIGCLGIGNMFQSNQAYSQIQYITGGADGFLGDKGWLVGGLLGLLVAVVVLGGIKSITRVTGKLVPLMAVTYFIAAIIVIGLNADMLGWALAEIWTQAFNPQGVAGGMFGVMAMGFKRSTFSNEAGLGSASIAHAAVRTGKPATEGLVGLLEPIIDTVIICPLTGLVILLTVFNPELVGTTGAGLEGVQLTSSAFQSVIWWFPYLLAIVVVMLAFSTIIAWAYYGQKGWTYLVGNSAGQKRAFYVVYCLFVALGCMLDVQVVIDFSDAIVFCMALPNVLGMYIMAPLVKTELQKYLAEVKG